MPKVEEYVKTKNGYIRKVVKEFAENCYLADVAYYNETIKEKTKGVLLDDIVKHSKNIIDLIEVGDYVNGMLVTTIINMDENGNYIPCRIILCNRDGDCTLPPLKIYEKDIKSIVTKEQFAQVQYKVGE